MFVLFVIFITLGRFSDPGKVKGHVDHPQLQFVIVCCSLIKKDCGQIGRGLALLLPYWGATAALITPARHKYACNPSFPLPWQSPAEDWGGWKQGVFGGPNLCSQFLPSPAPSSRDTGWPMAQGLSCSSHFPFHAPVVLLMSPFPTRINSKV